MKRIVEVRGIKLGEGAPKICVPMTGRTREELLEEAELLRAIDLDFAEWRVDFFEAADSLEQVLAVLAELRERLGGIPLIFTFRSAREGGQRELPLPDYARMNREAAASGHADLIDIELFTGEDAVRELTGEVRRLGAYSIVSNHDFDKTPPKSEIEDRLRRAASLGGDVPKIAVMPRDPGDVLTLLEATYAVNSEGIGPVVTMSMAATGAISRVAGGTFGSALTFGAAKNASAPGQLAAAELRGILKTLYGG
ncbi:type I 3-dehydroquinate dehydratase [Saccharibacillus sp. CPCC 101409]|uniref:type I 3-dehydroquinate dehydratase n=1 Tax=Saccharibacillus sp. CPCC 101409 TaxID=3058041 RepID=UPI0026739033|nr:type I 3-dehydroquinate dehydratase [Saccharibacillus sp. CPCC 101409]MDO3408197.1 type I 3-dehydroquinate dehydratase [Saccharibacillus sp. CPCC 101409]